jgi:hypothetical protein
LQLPKSGGNRLKNSERIASLAPSSVELQRALSLVWLVLAGADECNEGSTCTQGTALNVTNATGVCTKTNPFYPGTKVCEVCSDCHKKWPGCPCCVSVYDEPNACANCLVRDPYTIAKCGNHVVSYECDKTLESNPCVATPGKGGTFPTLGQCQASCSLSFNCVNDQCTKAPSTTPGKYPNLTSCSEVCGKPTKFNCENHKCVVASAGSGSFSNLTNCQNVCQRKPPVWWDCAPPLGCQGPAVTKGCSVVDGQTSECCFQDTMKPALALWDWDWLGTGGTCGKQSGLRSLQPGTSTVVAQCTDQSGCTAKLSCLLYGGELQSQFVNTNGKCGKICTPPFGCQGPPVTSGCSDNDGRSGCCFNKTARTKLRWDWNETRFGGTCASQSGTAEVMPGSNATVAQCTDGNACIATLYCSLVGGRLQATLINTDAGNVMSKSKSKSKMRAGGCGGECAPPLGCQGPAVTEGCSAVDGQTSKCCFERPAASPTPTRSDT